MTGTNQLIAPVCAAVLGDDQLGPPCTHVHHPDLEDALIALISDTTTTTTTTGGRSDSVDVRPLEGVA